MVVRIDRRSQIAVGWLVAALLTIAVLLTLGPTSSRAQTHGQSCDAVDVNYVLQNEEAMPFFHTFIRQVKGEYNIDDASNDVQAIGYGHALGRLASAVQDQPFRRTLFECVRVVIEKAFISAEPIQAPRLLALMQEGAIGVRDRDVALFAGVTRTDPYFDLLDTMVAVAGGAPGASQQPTPQPVTPQPVNPQPVNPQPVIPQPVIVQPAPGGGSGGVSAGTCNWITVTLQDEAPAVTCAGFQANGWLTRLTPNDCHVCDPDPVAQGAPPTPLSPAPPAASPDANGKYTGLLAEIYCPDDRSTYGDFSDWGQYSGGLYCGTNAPAGYWVYANDTWFIWANLAGGGNSVPNVGPGPSAPSPDVNGKYSGLLAEIYCPDDRDTYGDFSDWGQFSGGLYCGTNTPAGYWVYAVDTWFVWANMHQ